MSKSFYLFCEGNADSLDIQIFRQVKSRLRNNNIEVVPSGGKNGIKQFAKGYWEYGKLLDYNGYFIFRDRDFDIEVQENNNLILVEEKKAFCIFAGSRLTVENYFLNPEWIQGFLAKRSPKKNLSITDIESMFFSAANDLKFYTAARHAIGKLLREAQIENGEKGTPYINSTWLRASGTIPADFSESHSLNEGINHIKVFQSKASFFSPDKFERYFYEYKSILNYGLCNNLEQILKWYSGKDLISALIPNLGVNLTSKHEVQNYYKFIFKENLFDCSNYEDYQQLIHKINSF